MDDADIYVITVLGMSLCSITLTVRQRAHVYRLTRQRDSYFVYMYRRTVGSSCGPRRLEELNRNAQGRHRQQPVVAVLALCKLHPYSELSFHRQSGENVRGSPITSCLQRANTGLRLTLHWIPGNMDIAENEAPYEAATRAAPQHGAVGTVQ